MSHSLGPVSHTSSPSTPPPSHVPGPLPLSGSGGVAGMGSSVGEASSHEENRGCWAGFCAWVSRFVQRLLSCFGCYASSRRDEDKTEGVGASHTKSEDETDEVVEDETDEVVEDETDEVVETSSMVNPELHLGDGISIIAVVDSYGSTEGVVDASLREVYDNMIEAELSLIAPDKGRALKFALGENTYWIWCDPGTRMVFIEEDNECKQSEFVKLRPLGEDGVKYYRPEGVLPLSTLERDVLTQLLERVQWVKEEKERLRELANRFNPMCLGLLFSFFSGPLGANLRYNPPEKQKDAMRVRVPKIEGEGNELFRVWVRVEGGKYYFNFQEAEEYNGKYEWNEATQRYDTWIASQKKKLGICLNAEGAIESVYIEGSPAEKAVFEEALYNPNSEWNKRLTEIINQFLFNYAFYIGGLPGGVPDTMAVHRLAIEQVPELILRRLIDQGQLRNLRHKDIKFITDAFNEEMGIDAGGPKKEFVSLLARSLLAGNTSSAITMNAGIPVLERDGAISALQSLGALFSLCHGSNLLITGRLLPDRYFQLLSHLAKFDNDIGQSLGESEMLQAIGALIQGDSAIPEWISPCVFEGQALSDEQKEYVDMTLCLEPENDDYREALREWLLVVYPKQIKAARHIVAGMTPEARLAFRSQAPNALSNQVQGLAFNREVIANRIEMSYVAQQCPEIREKVQWLKEHILDERTPQAWVEHFLFTVTGQKALSGANKITIQPSSDEACHAHTCFSSIEVPQSHTDLGSDPSKNPTTKQKFLNNLQITMDAQGYDAG